MSDETKKIYRVLRPIAFGGRREIGETIELTDEEALNLGDEYVVALEPAPATAGAEPVKGSKVEGETPVKAKRTKKSK